MEFQTLKDKISRNIALTENEAETFCLGILLSENESLDDYPCCNNYKFYTLYLTYYKNIAGGVKYYKLDREEVRREIQTIDDLKSADVGAFLSEISNYEAEKDLEYLYSIADAWEETIRKQNHTEDLLQTASKEARNDLKELEKANKSNSSLIKGFKYIKEKRAILMRSKWVYLKAKSILESNKPADYVLNLMGEDVYITPFTLIHVINRHFAASTRYNFSAKTYHSEDIDPQNFHLLLKGIFDIINTSYITDKVDPDNIMFEYNERVYMLHTSVEERPVKGQGNVLYRRMNTIYPIPVSTVKKEIDRGCIRYKLRANVFFYHRSRAEGSWR